MEPAVGFALAGRELRVHAHGNADTRHTSRGRWSLMQQCPRELRSRLVMLFSGLLPRLMLRRELPPQRAGHSERLLLTVARIAHHKPWWRVSRYRRHVRPRGYAPSLNRGRAWTSRAR